MPRSMSVAASTRSLVDGMRDWHRRHADTLTVAYEIAGPAVLPDDDASLLRFQRLLEKARQAGQLPQLSAAPSPAEIAHFASILMWRDWWGRRKYQGELLPLWLVNQGYPILHEVVARGVVRSLCRQIPREVMFGGKEARTSWVEKFLEERAAAARTSGRGDPDRAHLLDELTDSIASDTLPGGPDVRRAQARREAQEELESGLRSFLLQAAGEPASPDLARFVGSVLELNTVYGETNPEEALEPREVVSQLSSRADIVSLLENDPPMDRLLQETRRVWVALSHFAFLKTKKGLAVAEEHELLMQTFLVVCSFEVLGIGPTRE